MRRKILIVDDEKSIRDSLRLLLKQNFDIETAENGEEALSHLKSQVPDVVLLDVMMPRMDGIETLTELRKYNREIPVIMLTASNTVRTAVEAMKLGAFDYINKPFDVDELTSLVLSCLSVGEAGSAAEEEEQQQGSLPPKRVVLPGDFGALVGKSDSMQSVYDRISQIAPKDTTVLITGESGTGKELVAARIHELSGRSDKPFIAINCAAIPETLIESELFGHVKGAFTHALEERVGHFELANGGTLFLDEIGELSLPVQVKMLRFLQEQEFFRVGSSKPSKVNVRVIAATNKKLEDLIQEGKFREDLYYRIHVINVELPPLRERYEDVVGLVDYFVRSMSSNYGGKTIRFTEEATEALTNYLWPGNVRELQNLVESLIALSEKELLELGDLPSKLRNPAAVENLKTKIFEDGLSFEEAEQRFETEVLLKALRKTNFVQTKAADLLGISRRILKYKMDKLGISDPAEEAENAANAENASSVIEDSCAAEEGKV